MPDIFRRFEAPDRPIHAARFRAPGLGAEAEEVIPDSASPDDPRVLPGQTHANERFYGIRSRSRFFGLLTPPPVGHGRATAGVPGGRTWSDPGAGRSQFDEREVEPFRKGLSASSRTELPIRAEYAPSLGQKDPELAREGILDFARPDYGVTATAAQPVIGPPSWYAAGPIPASLRATRRGTFRREFMQWAQTFFGRHELQAHDAPGSSSPVSMLAARTNRLTERRLPSSFGAQTEVVR